MCVPAPAILKSILKKPPELDVLLTANIASRSETPSPPLFASRPARELVLPFTVSLALVTTNSPYTALMLAANSDVELLSVLVAVAVILVPGAIIGISLSLPVTVLKVKLPAPSVSNQPVPR